MNKLQETISKALMVGIQTGVGKTFHQDANALVMLAFEDAESAQNFYLEYLTVKGEAAVMQDKGMTL